jgi:glycerophosphoryl diester phosphodiesterase
MPERDLLRKELGLPQAWRRAPERPLVLGHRGARYAAPENTLSAFELSRSEGAEGTELDVQLSRDGEAFVVHDFDLTRVTGGKVKHQIRQLSAEQLAQVELLGGERIPTLSEVLDWAEKHGQLLNVELKSERARHDRIVQRVAELLDSRPGAENWVLVSSFHPLLLGRFRLRAPHIPTGFLVGEHHPRLLAAAWPRLLGCQAVHPQANMVLARPWLRSLAADFPFNAWTVNDVELGKRLAELGVNALISDNPGALLRGLAG